MSKAKTPSFVLTLPLVTEKYQEDVLNKRFEIGRNIYNSCIREQYKRLNRMKQSKEYGKIAKSICKIYKEENKLKCTNRCNHESGNYNDKERRELYKRKYELYKQFGLTEYKMHPYVVNMRKTFKDNFDSHTLQKIASQANKSLQKLLFGNGRKMYFSKYGEFNSLEGKSNTVGIKYRDGCVFWNKLKIKASIKTNDRYAHMALTSRIKYCRLQRKMIRGKQRFFIQLVLEGIPPHKIDKKTGSLKTNPSTGRVGIDIGTQTIAIASEKGLKLLELAPSVNKAECEKRNLQRKLERQRRANNAHKYNKDGSIISNSEEWLWSKNYIKTKNQLAELLRKQADKRKQDHYKLCNTIIEMGNDVYVETMDYKELQERVKDLTADGKIKRKKRYGKSIANKAPSMFLTMLDDKLRHLGRKLLKINTYKVKASQYNHAKNEYEKFGLSVRWKIVAGKNVQRDLYSAFLIMNMDDNLENINRQLCINTWNNFVEMHDIEIERVKKCGDKLISSMGL